MAIIADIILILIIASSIYQGYRQGLIKSLAGVASMAVAILGAIIFLSPMANYINTNHVAPFITEKIMVSTDVNFDNMSDEEFANKITESSKDLKELAVKFGVKAEDVDKLVEAAKNPEGAKSEAVNKMTEPISMKVSKFIAFAVLYIGLSILVRIALIFLNNIFKMPLLKGANKLLGAGIGGIEGIIIVFVISLIAYNLLPKIMAIPDVNLPLQFISDSYIVNLLGKINVLQLIGL